MVRSAATPPLLPQVAAQLSGPLGSEKALEESF